MWLRGHSPGTASEGRGYAVRPLVDNAVALYSLAFRERADALLPEPRRRRARHRSAAPRGDELEHPPAA